MQLLKEKTLTKIFVEQDNNDVAFYSSNSRGGTFEKSNMEAKKKKISKTYY
jgi:hypothetical protein